MKIQDDRERCKTCGRPPPPRASTINSARKSALKTTPEERRRMVQLRRGGMEATKIAKIMGVCCSTVRRHTTRHASSYRRLTVTLKQIDEMQMLFDQAKRAARDGWVPQEKLQLIADKVGVCVETVRRYMLLSNSKREKTRTNSELEQVGILVNRGVELGTIAKLNGWAKDTLENPGQELAYKHGDEDDKEKR